MRTRELVIGLAIVAASACGGGAGSEGVDAPGDGGGVDAAVCVPGEWTVHWSFTFPTHLDDTCITEFELTGFRVRYGTAADDLTGVEDAPTATSCVPSGEQNACGPILSCSHTVTGLTGTLWFFSVAVIQSGSENPGSYPQPVDVTCPDLSGCPDTSATVTQERGFYIDDGTDRVWGYVAGDAANYYRILIHSASAHGGPTVPGTYTFSAADADNFTCGTCVSVYLGDRIFMPKPGSTYTFTALDGAVGGHFAGSVENLELQEVTIDPSNLTTTPVANGLMQCLPSYSWDVVME